MERIYNGDWDKFRSAVIFAGAVPSKDSGVDMFNSLSFESLGDHWGIAATDRYRLAWVGVNLSADEFRLMSADYRALISAPEILKAVKPARVSAWHLAIDEDRRVWSLNVDGSIFGGDLVNGDFPKWRQLTPLSLDSAGENLAGAICYDPILLGGILSGIVKAFGKGSKVKLAPSDSEHGAKTKAVTLSGFSERAGALIMPVRQA
jgi:hypothetical protein